MQSPPLDEPGPDPAAPPPRPRALALPLHRPWLVNAILVLNVVMFALLTLAARDGVIEALLNGADGRALIFFGAKVNRLIVEGQWWRLLTPIFLHIGLIHLLFNQYALMAFGRELEALFGAPRFALLYLLSGMFGNVASFAFNAATSAGASGAIFGVIGGMAAFFVRNRQTLGAGARAQLRSLGTLVLLNGILGLTFPAIDNFGHGGGLVSGFLLGLLLTPTFELRPQPEPPFTQVVARPGPLPLLVALGGLLLVAATTFLALPLAPLR